MTCSTAGAGYAFIVRALGDDNAGCNRRDLVTIDSVRNHCERHFPVQQVARATYRDIVERQARENQIDFVKGVATALLPVTFYEVAMNKAFRTLVDDRTEVSVETGLQAAAKLQSVLAGGERDTEVLELKVALAQTRAGRACRCPGIDVAGDHREAGRTGTGPRRCSTSVRTPSMTLTTSPTTQPSSSTRTTNSDLRSAAPDTGLMTTAAGFAAWPVTLGTVGAVRPVRERAR